MADMSYRNSPEGGDLAAALRALPLVAPTQSEWPRLSEAFAARARRRRTTRWSAVFATAAVLALAVGLGRLQLAERAPDAQVATATPVQGGTDALIARNQELQAMLRGFDVRSAPMDGEAALASARLEDLIAMLDVELGDAPAPGEAEALWQQRLVLLQELASVRQQGQAAVAQQGDGAGLVPASWVVD
jgi:hypothetical protein